jgi:hypothetical protein
MEFLSHPKVMALVAIFSIPVFSTLAKPFWRERFETLGETVKYLLWPDIYSLFKGRYWDDWYASTKSTFSSFYVSVGLPPSLSFWQGMYL